MLSVIVQLNNAPGREVKVVAWSAGLDWKTELKKWVLRSLAKLLRSK
jgi:hypothetical protein